MTDKTIGDYFDDIRWQRELLAVAMDKAGYIVEPFLVDLIKELTNKIVMNMEEILKLRKQK